MSNFSPNHNAHGNGSRETDEALVSAAQQGCQRAFESLINRYFGLIYTLAFARLHDHEASQDLAQEVFLRLYMGLGSLREPRYFGTWASRVARNLATDWLRNRQRASTLITLVPLEESGVEHKPAAAPGARERLLESEQLRELRAAIMALPIEQREILLLHYQRGMTQQEIGVRLDMHHSTVCRHLQRAVSQLRRWSRDLEILNSAPASPAMLPARERQAMVRTVALLSAAAALGSEAKTSLASVAADGMTQLGTAAVHHAAASTAATSNATATAAATAAKTATLAVKGATMTAKTKAGVAVLAAVTALGATYHQTHPGELTQLMRGTSPSMEKIQHPAKTAKTFHTPTMGPGEEVYSGMLGPKVEQIVVRIKPVPGGVPLAQFDVPGALIMEYPMKVVSVDGDKMRIEAIGQFALNVTRSQDALVGDAKLYVTRKDIPSTCPVELKRMPGPVPIGRDLPPIVDLPSDPKYLDQFVGEYAISSAMTIKVTREGEQLYAQTPRQDPLPIYHMGNNRFFYKALPEELSFGPGPDGKIVRVVLHGPRDTPGRKVS